jgi:adenosylhomocysteine nucleosidase
LTSIGLVVALPREIPTRFARIAVCEGSGRRPFPFYRRTCGTFEMIAVQSGIGYQRAAAATRLLMHRFTPQALISFGFAGGLLPEVAPGTLIVGAQLVHEGQPRDTPLEANHELVEQFVAAAREERLLVRPGRLITAHHLIADIPSKAALARKSGACAVDMETAGVAELAHAAGLAWVAVRAVVDTADEDLPAACLKALRVDGRVALGSLLWALWRSPRLVHHFLWLDRRTRTARQCLAHVLDRWIQDQRAQCSPGQG